MKNNLLIISGVIALALVLGAVVIFGGAAQTNGVPDGKYDAFAQCLKDKGVTFFGAFWCPHCQRTKAMFGSSEKLLPYVECSTPDGQGQTQVCKDNKVEGYPTWQFPDGSRLTGERTMQELADKSGCMLPGGSASVPAATAGQSSSATAPTQN